jgi:hypothetical protein
MRKASRVLFAAAALAALVFPVRAAAITTIEQLQSQPQLLNGKDVVLTGRVSFMQRGVTSMGEDYTEFLLCDKNCITVWVRGDPNIREGDYVTIHNSLSEQPVSDPLLLNGIVVHDYDIY